MNLDKRFSVLSLALSGLLTSTAGCAASDKWAEDLENALKCGMTGKEVAKLAGTQPTALERQDRWRTHIIERAPTRVSFGFSNGRLKLAQISWDEKPTRIASYQVLDLCGDASPDLEATYRLPKNP